MDGPVTEDEGRQEPTEDDKIVKEAKKRFELCESWESHARAMFIEDMKFAHGDADNQYQWPNEMLRARDVDQKPTLTINKVRQHCLQIINDAKQNKPGVVVHPTTDDASYEAAQVFEDVVRYIERESRAEQAYDKASENQVYGGIGYVRVVAAYSDGASFDQELRIKAVPDALTVYLDPDAKEADKSDMRFAFVFDDMPKDRFKQKYPGYAESVSTMPLSIADGWIGENHVRVAEYWRVATKDDELYTFIDPDSQQRVTIAESACDKEMLDQVKRQPTLRKRPLQVETIECFLIAADQIIERSTWLGKWIPIVAAVGEETVIEGVLDRKGHTRYLKDPQRMYNYHSSAATEAVALQTKTPFVAPAAAIEGFEEYWQDANKENLAYLPYNHIDSNGEEIPPPKRNDPAVMPTAMVKGMEIAQTEMMMASGQYQSQFGENENATSGKAINERQRQGDNATYHFVDNHAVMIRQVGRILVDAIPKYYDTPRVLLIRGQNGSKRMMRIDPNAKQSMAEAPDNDSVDIIFNPAIGKYAVDADVGPGYATRRQEAWNAITQILAQNKELTNVLGDILFRNADFPNADEIAERLARLVPAHAKGDAPPPEVQQMQAQLQQLSDQMQKLMEQMAIDKLKLTSKEVQDSVAIMDAQTRRLVAEGNAGPYVTQDQVQPLIVQSIMQMLSQKPPQDGQGAPGPSDVAPQLPPPPASAAAQPQGMTQ